MATWYLFDGLGSVVGELDGDGNVDGKRAYDVFGAVRWSEGTDSTDHKFVGSLGHVSEDETGLIYMRARHMDPALGRFISEDPAHNGRNWFVYCRGNPVSNVDPDGQVALPVIAAAALAIVGGAISVAEAVGFQVSPTLQHIQLATSLASFALVAGIGVGALVSFAGSVETMGIGTGLAVGAGVAVGIALTGVLTTLAIQQVALAMLVDEI